MYIHKSEDGFQAFDRIGVRIVWGGVFKTARAAYKSFIRRHGVSLATFTKVVGG